MKKVAILIVVISSMILASCSSTQNGAVKGGHKRYTYAPSCKYSCSQVLR